MIPSNHDECADSDKITQAPGVTQFGTYNMFPEPTREISADIFNKRISRQVITGTETRQPRDLGYATLRLFWFAPGYGVGVSQHQLSTECMYRYWLFGCEHKFVEQEATEYQKDLIGEHVHVYVCELCGYQEILDNSG